MVPIVKVISINGQPIPIHLIKDKRYPNFSLNVTATIPIPDPIKVLLPSKSALKQVPTTMD